MSEVKTREELGLPWIASEFNEISESASGEWVLDVCRTLEHAAFIVTAANAHHDLVEALEGVLQTWRLTCGDTDMPDAAEFANDFEGDCIPAIEAALAKAKGGAS